jgi:hypothetical protein
MSRLVSGTAFLAVALAFALPFGAVASCDGEEVRFTGIELATFDVEPDDSQSGTLHETVERNASVLAISVLVAAAFGLGLTLVARPGAGIAASLGLVTLQILGVVILVSADGATSLLAGYWLAFVAMAVAGGTYLVQGVKARRRKAVPSVRWAVSRGVLAFLPSLLVLALLAVVGIGALFE